MDNWLDAVQAEITQVDPMLRVRLNEVSVRLFERGFNPELAALAYIDQFKEDMKIVMDRLKQGLSITDINAKWKN
jgi:hypothetical protein